MHYGHALPMRQKGRISGAVLVALILLGAILFRLLTPAYDTQLAAARARWESRSFSRYRLVMRAPTWCRVDVEVRDERVVTVFQNTCPSGVRTVTDLFELISRLDRSPAIRHCSPDGCQCTETTIARADYDAQLGFPRTIRLRRQREVNWPLFWRYLFSRGPPLCFSPPDTEFITVLWLKPMAEDAVRSSRCRLIQRMISSTSASSCLPVEMPIWRRMIVPFRSTKMLVGMPRRRY